MVVGIEFPESGYNRLLLDLVHYEKKGFMLDTGHFRIRIMI